MSSKSEMPESTMREILLKREIEFVSDARSRFVEDGAGMRRFIAFAELLRRGVENPDDGEVVSKICDFLAEGESGVERETVSDAVRAVLRNWDGELAHADSGRGKPEGGKSDDSPEAERDRLMKAAANAGALRKMVSAEHDGGDWDGEAEIRIPLSATTLGFSCLVEEMFPENFTRSSVVVIPEPLEPAFVMCVLLARRMGCRFEVDRVEFDELGLDVRIARMDSGPRSLFLLFAFIPLIELCPACGGLAHPWPMEPGKTCVGSHPGFPARFLIRGCGPWGVDAKTSKDSDVSVDYELRMDSLPKFHMAIGEMPKTFSGISCPKGWRDAVDRALREMRLDGVDLDFRELGIAPDGIDLDFRELGIATDSVTCRISGNPDVEKKFHWLVHARFSDVRGLCPVCGKRMEPVADMAFEGKVVAHWDNGGTWTKASMSMDGEPKPLFCRDCVESASRLARDAVLHYRKEAGHE